MFNFTEKQEIIEYLQNTEGNVYIGCDSVRKKARDHITWVAEYSVTFCVHINNANGCKIFYYKEKEPIFGDPKKPGQRLMNEVFKTVELYKEFEYELIDRDVEIHLDVNPLDEFASSKVVKQAKGYVLGVIGIDPQLKPDAYAASYAADHAARNKKF